MQHRCNVHSTHHRTQVANSRHFAAIEQAKQILQFQDGSPPCLRRGHDQRGCAFQATPGFCHGRRVSYRVPRTRVCALLAATFARPDLTDCHAVDQLAALHCTDAPCTPHSSCTRSPHTSAHSPSTPPSHHLHASTNQPNLRAHPHLRLLINSFGYYDIGFRNPLIKTPTLDALVKNEAALLTRHYTFKYCSPTRRSFLVRCHVTTCDGPSGHRPLNLELSIAMQETAPSFEFHAGPWMARAV